MLLPRLTVPKNFKLIGGGGGIGGGPVGAGGGAITGRAAAIGFGIATTGGVYTSEKIFRPVPEYTKLSVRSIADSSSVGSRLDDVVASFVAATPAAFPPGKFFAFVLELDELVELVFAAVSATGAGAGGGGGVLGPPNSVL